jgi:CheY-like chemotaxis protein
MTIVYVDDDPDDALIFHDAIKQIDHSIICLFASDGVEAMRVISNQCPDFTFLDFRMPLQDGLELLNEIRQQSCFHRTKVVMYSTWMNDRQVEECRKLGVYDCLKKSSQFLELCSMLRKTLGLQGSS